MNAKPIENINRIIYRRIYAKICAEMLILWKLIKTFKTKDEEKKMLYEKWHN